MHSNLNYQMQSGLETMTDNEMKTPEELMRDFRPELMTRLCKADPLLMASVFEFCAKVIQPDSWRQGMTDAAVECHRTRVPRKSKEAKRYNDACDNCYSAILAARDAK